MGITALISPTSNSSISTFPSEGMFPTTQVEILSEILNQMKILNTTLVAHGEQMKQLSKDVALIKQLGLNQLTSQKI